MNAMLSDRAQLQRTAQTLGYLGLLPFAAALSFLMLDWYPDKALSALHAYAAIILTFIGAIHWGIGLHNGDDDFLALAVIPSLVAWISLMMEPEWGLPVMTMAFVGMAWYDGEYFRILPWFRVLRRRLTLVVVGVLMLAWWGI